jgi:hypothetical protein
MLYDGVDETLDVRGFAHVGRHAERVPAGAHDLVGGFRNEIRAARANRNLGALPRELDCGGFADAFGGAGDDCNFAFQSQFHYSLPNLEKSFAAKDAKDAKEDETRKSSSKN